MAIQTRTFLPLLGIHLRKSFAGVMKRLLPILVMAAVACEGAPARGDDEFAETCARVLQALRAEDWTALQKECAEEIVFERFRRIYLQFYPRTVAKDLLGGEAWINDDYVNHSVTEPEDENDRDVSVTHGVLMNRKPSKDERRAFHQFCGFVRDSYERDNSAITWGLNVRGEEVTSLFGPAIEGRVASNFKWRVQLEQIDGHWLVRKLITEEH